MALNLKESIRVKEWIFGHVGVVPYSVLVVLRVLADKMLKSGEAWVKCGYVELEDKGMLSRMGVRLAVAEAERLGLLKIKQETRKSGNSYRLALSRRLKGDFRAPGTTVKRRNA